MSQSDASSSIRAFSVVVRLFCIVPFATGAADMVGGAWILGQAGAVIPDGMANDPVVNNQIAFWGAIWLGFGVSLWWVSNEPLSRVAVARMLFAILFMSGLARAYASFRWGFPGLVLAGAMGIELLWSPVLLFWIQRLERRGRS